MWMAGALEGGEVVLSLTGRQQVHSLDLGVCLVHLKFLC